MAENKIGRPLKFKSVEEMQLAILKYFAECDENDIPYTVTGLALALDTSRKVLVEYQGKDEYSNTIKRAKLMCENYAERHLFVGKSGVTGAIFSLKNNYGWVDKQEIVQTEKPVIKITRTKVSEEENLSEDE